MKNIKKLSLLGAVLLMCCLFTSCIDYVQSVYTKGNKIVNNYKITVSKLFLSQTDEDVDELFDAFHDIEDTLPKNAYYRKIDNSTDIGFELKFAIDIDTEDEEEIFYIPFISDETEEYYFPFILGQEADFFEELLYSEGDEEMQAIMLMYLANAKCRYIVSKELMPVINCAYFDGEDSQVELPVYNYGDSYGIEIPLITLALGNADNLDMSYIIAY